MIRVLFRRGSPKDLAGFNPVLKPGEPCVEMEGRLSRLKIGDGITPWSELPYVKGVVIGAAHWIEGRFHVVQE